VSSSGTGRARARLRRFRFWYWAQDSRPPDPVGQYARSPISNRRFFLGALASSPASFLPPGRRDASAPGKKSVSFVQICPRSDV